MFDLKKVWGKLKLPLILIFLALGLGTLGYKILYPDVPIEKLIFMTGITLSTVGYGDVLGVENNTVAIFYTMFVMLMGMGIVLYSVSLITAYFIEGTLRDAFIINSMRRKVKKMKDHFIICGAGMTGFHVVREMYQTNFPFVVVDTSTAIRDQILAEFPSVPVIIGDVTSDEVLEQANIKNAKGLIATLSSDKDNLFLTVSSKLLNPKITVVARAIDLSMVGKLKNAGAKYVVSPNFIGGMRIASEILRPNVVSFLDKMLRGIDKSIRVEEVVLPAIGHYVGKSIKEAHVFSRTGVNIIAYSDGDGKFTYNPSPSTVLNPGGVLLFIATAEQREKITNFFTLHCVAS
ncbi:MAG: hypothetical protein HOE90_14265 [Bacteriovoracaceae bacterium]|jgi:voltage-gated potassium channel|nr:hypothetical protein [Bacteriovoracaceae bacterium]